MEDNKDNSVKETEQKPQEKAEGKTGGKTMAEKAIDRFAQMMVTRASSGKKAGLTVAAGRRDCLRISLVAATQDIMTSSSSCIPPSMAMMPPSMPPISRFGMQALLSTRGRRPCPSSTGISVIRMRTARRYLMKPSMP